MKTASFLFLAILCASVANAAEPTLVGHWKLDDKEGDVAVDSSEFKNNGKLINSPGRTTAPFGGAMTFDGKTQYVEIPNSKELENVQEGSFTLAAWVKPTDVPAGTDSANNANYAVIAKTGWHLAISYSNEKKFTVATWLKGDTDPQWVGTGAWETEYEPDAWHHVAAVIDRDSRTVQFFVDGELKGTSDQWPEDAKPHEYGEITWKIGVAAPGSETYAWYAKAAIGDVRIYSSALSESKVRDLFEKKAE
jgi:hypothetical protein